MAASAPTLKQALAELKKRASPEVLAGYARYAIPSEGAWGVAMRDVQALAKQLGRPHVLADALWDAGIYEARLLACYVADPKRMTAEQMQRWVEGMDNWAVVDTACFALFDRTNQAWALVKAWTPREELYVRRAGFALIWGLSVHDKTAKDALFLDALKRVEKASTDERHFVMKSVSMALRATGKRNAALRAAAVDLATKLAASGDATQRALGKEALRELQPKTKA
ncbi:DNA alkylation repair protein [Pelomonas sp. SE-A7]|uniref:DNA alkylation repair protein n=1 Tax=Pelomonas sp. SE-A7 TaxID=3054953 RepID=UPI00259CCDF0|nr:DNA alkylation repair protein [Pelomonas sp. SE-A7]MDM4765692.1 DNA alkylation repair protein [Pelomonas sp. SE-A7]